MVQVHNCDTLDVIQGVWIFSDCNGSIDTVDKVEGTGSLLLTPVGPAWESRAEIQWWEGYHPDWSLRDRLIIAFKAQSVAARPVKIMIFAPDYANRKEITIDLPAANIWQNRSILFAEMTDYGTPNMSNVSALYIWYIRSNDMLEFRIDNIRAESGMPPKWNLSVNSTPIAGVPFTIEGINMFVTPWSGPLVEGTYVITMPANVIVDEINYNFVSWEDGSTNPARTINLLSDMTLMATYEVGVAPPPRPCFIATVAYGSNLAPQLNVLRRFRDKCLPDTLVAVYYRVGARLASWIKGRRATKRYMREVLDILIEVIRSMGVME